MMDIPRDMKGFEKSITSSLTRVMVSGATAISAFCQREREQKKERESEKRQTEKCFIQLLHVKTQQGKIFFDLCFLQEETG